MPSSVRSNSSSEENVTAEADSTSLKGVLCKWTNYYYGWQERYVCCERGSLFYYRSREETSFGCRGTISLDQAHVTLHEYDSCRFDVTINETTWYLRSADEAERQQWVSVIEANMLERDTISMEGDDSLAEKEDDFRIKVTELRSFRSILSNQVDVLQRYFDACLTLTKEDHMSNRTKQSDAGSPVDADTMVFLDDSQQDSFELSKSELKREALSFKVTTQGIETALNDFIAMVDEREEMWKQKCQRLQIKINSSPKEINLHTEDLSESPNVLDGDDSDDEFFDPNNNFEVHGAKKHRYAQQVDEKIREHLSDSFDTSGSGMQTWELLAEDQDTKLFRKEFVKDGVVCDPIKAHHKSRGVTARELCYYFWETSCRTQWDQSLEEISAVEVIDDITMVIHQVHKQVWPITQRDCVYISTILKVDDPPSGKGDQEPYDTWMVCNFTIEHDGALVKPGRVRAVVEVALVCQTYIAPPNSATDTVTRDRLRCDIVYIAKIDPGGWAPPGIVRAVGKREYPKFLRNFTNFVEKKTKNSEILL